METLEQIYNKHKKGDWPDKGSVHSYIEVYEELLMPYRYSAKYILEIGLMSGESLRMWTDYFHGGIVCGMDCTMTPINGQASLYQAKLDGYNIYIGDASNPDDLEKYFKDFKFDVIIEDANHDIQQQLKIFSELYKYLNKGGIYIIEDVQDIDRDGHLFVNWGMTVVDRRKIKNRYDDVLVIIRK